MAGNDDIELLPLSSFRQEKIEWLLWPFIPLGFVTMLTGETSAGKSTMITDIIGRLTRGTRMPRFGDRLVANPPIEGSVLYLCKEDSPSMMIGPRLWVADADLDKVHMPVVKQTRFRKFHRHMDSLDQGVENLEREIKKIGDVKLVFIDPIMSFVGKAGAYTPHKVRELMNPISELAMRHKIAIVCTLHMSKDKSKRGNDRMLGSGSFVQVARSKLFVVAPEPNSSKRLLISERSNISSERNNAVEFDLVRNDTDHPEVVWGRELEDIDSDKLNKLLDGKASHISKRARAADMLEELLADGPVSANDVEQAALAEGIGMNTVEAAKKDLGVRSVHRSDGSWWWEFPQKPAKQEAKKPKDERLRSIVPGGQKRVRA
jgi:archaellum biogenesis ATPase FlaH